MGSRNKRWWQEVPWGWVLVSAYCTTLTCVAISQMTGLDSALTLLKDYQTLVAGLATVAALFIAVWSQFTNDRLNSPDLESKPASR